MKKLFILVVVAANFLSCTGNKSGTDAAVESGDYYTCPMHPSVHSDKPGACPVCGMALVKKSAVTEETSVKSVDYYTCPMHPSVRSDTPGACPICGMDLIKKSAVTSDMADSVMPNIIRLTGSQRVTANVSVTVVERRSLAKEITAVGVVDIAEPLQTTVSARFRGRIEKLYVNYTGEVVRKGQLLFELYSPDLMSAQQELLVARDARDDSPSEMTEQLLQSSRQRLQMHFGLTREQIRTIESRKKILSATKFYAPIAGTVLRKAVQEGQYVDEGMMLYQLADLSRVWVYADVYEREASLLRLGQTLTLSSETYPGETFTGKIIFIEPTISSESRTVRVRTEVANPSGKLKPSMYVSSRISVQLDNALVVPSTAVISTGKRTVVWIEVAENQFESREVVLGSMSNGYYAVLKGLSEGDHVVTTGGFLIDSESQLQH